MIFSYKHLKKMANLNKKITHINVVEAINSIGFEVESVKNLNNVKGIKFGKILNIYKNENSDNLTVCEVLFNDKTRTIQTTAKNMEINKFVIAFVPGSKIGDFEITEKTLKGIKSEGMLAGYDELGFSKNLVSEELLKGVIILDFANLEEDPIEKLELEDFLIDISILPNRSDANSYLIMAKELGAFFHSNIAVSNDIDLTKLTFENSFSNLQGVLLEKYEYEINLYEKILLLKSNFQITNSFKDLENLILLETGMPVQFLQINSINEIKIAEKSGNWVLENKNLKLFNNLIIEKNKKNIGFPYLVAEKEFHVQQGKTFFILMNILNPKEIRRNSKVWKVENEHAKQASKIISHGTQKKAIQYIAKKFNNIKLLNIDLTKKTKIIPFNKKFIDEIAGFNLSEDAKFLKVIDSLKILEFKFEEENILVPDYRYDFTGQYDVIEELFRFYGYDNFPNLQPDINSFKIQKFYDFKKVLASKNYHEVRTYSLIAKKDNKFNPFDFKEEILLKTFPSETRSAIRNSQAISILEVAKHNIKRKIEVINLFDVGMINKDKRTLIFASNEKSFNEIKKDLFSLFNFKFELQRTNNENFQNNTSAFILYNNEIIGWIGKINPEIEYSNLIFVEILFDKFNSSKNIFSQYEKNALKIRDITFSINKNESIKTYLDVIKKLNNLFEIRIIDKFQKENKLNITVRIMIDENEISKLDEMILNNNWN